MRYNNYTVFEPGTKVLLPCIVDTCMVKEVIDDNSNVKTNKVLYDLKVKRQHDHCGIAYLSEIEDDQLENPLKEIDILDLMIELSRRLPSNDTNNSTLKRELKDHIESLLGSTKE